MTLLFVATARLGAANGATVNQILAEAFPASGRKR
jgi:hypothetical protein